MIGTLNRVLLIPVIAILDVLDSIEVKTLRARLFIATETPFSS